MMSGIRGKDTKPELTVRRALHARGFRFATSPPHLPGRPDLVMPKWRVAVFVHGCFWHLHGCHLSKAPSTNRHFWEKKLAENSDRDAQAEMTLISMGWRIAMIWECSMRGKAAMSGFNTAMDDLAQWIRTQPLVVAHETPRPVSATC